MIDHRQPKVCYNSCGNKKMLEKLKKSWLELSTPESPSIIENYSDHPIESGGWFCEFIRVNFIH